MHRFNVFEGCRRITNLFLAIWAIGCVAISYSNSTSLDLQFDSHYPNSGFSLYYVDDATIIPSDNPWDKYSQKCGSNDLSEYKYLREPDYPHINATLCFRAMEFGEDKTMLIPHTVKNDMVYGNTKYSDDVQSYVKSQKESFIIPAKYKEKIDSIYFKKRIDHYKTALKFLLGGLFVIWLLSTVIGWIARGFMGVALGEDHRPQQD